MLKEVISRLLNEHKGWFIISDLGRIGREVYRQRKKRIFILQGAMGHSLSVSLGLALNCPSKRFLCLIGDGACLMKLGSLATIFDKKPKNLHIIILNNKCMESTGGQPTSFDAIANNLILPENIDIIDYDSGNEPAPRPNKTCKQITDDFRKDIHNSLQGRSK
jgi:thiamine pyrophosphate-dependent acetolactate synthase large subunit-like protein